MQTAVRVLWLKEKFLLRLARLTGINTHNKQQGAWLWCGRETVVVDGSSFLMADTAENQAEYPQHKNPAKGCGFPIGRIVLLFSLATGAVLDSAISAFCVGEINLFRRLFPHYWQDCFENSTNGEVRSICSFGSNRYPRLSTRLSMV